MTELIDRYADTNTIKAGEIVFGSFYQKNKKKYFEKIQSTVCVWVFVVFGICVCL